MGHNVATFTRPNCFPLYFFRLKRVPEIGLAVFPQAKWFSIPIFRVKNEIQNWNPEFASHYGMAVGGSATGSAGRRPAPRRPARPQARPRRPAGLGSAPAPRSRPARRPARQAGRQAQARSKAGSACARVNVRKPAPVAPVFEQKSPPGAKAHKRARERRGQLSAAPGIGACVYFMREMTRRIPME